MKTNTPKQYVFGNNAADLRNLEEHKGFALLVEEYEHQLQLLVERILSTKTGPETTMALKEAFYQLSSTSFHPSKIVKKLYAIDMKE
jgi:hypothetical protein